MAFSRSLDPHASDCTIQAYIHWGKGKALRKRPLEPQSNEAIQVSFYNLGMIFRKEINSWRTVKKTCVS